ncbi:nitronate monooxygenase, partial [Acinetobacter baumannii]
AAPAAGGLDFAAQFAAALASPATVLSFTFGVLSAGQVAAVKARGMMLVGTATTVAEAVQLEALGVDAVVAQGAEAGGHRGSFAGDFGASMI